MATRSARLAACVALVSVLALVSGQQDVQDNQMAYAVPPPPSAVALPPLTSEQSQSVQDDLKSFIAVSAQATAHQQTGLKDQMHAKHKHKHTHGHRAHNRLTEEEKLERMRGWQAWAKTYMPAQSYYEHYYSNARFKGEFYPVPGSAVPVTDVAHDKSSEKMEEKADAKKEKSAVESFLETVSQHKRRVDYRDEFNGDRFAESQSAYGVSGADSPAPENAYGPPMSTPGDDGNAFSNAAGQFAPVAVGSQPQQAPLQLAPTLQQQQPVQQQVNAVGFQFRQMVQAAADVAQQQQLAQQQQALQQQQLLQQQQVAAQQQQLATQQQLAQQQQFAAQQAQAQAQENAQIGAQGTPTPFYAPIAFPPPAPNQVPASAAAVSGITPQATQLPTTAMMRFAAVGSTQAPAVNINALAANPNVPRFQQQTVNSYPFGGFSFVELESNPVPEDVIHPHVYSLATHPMRHASPTPLHREHFEPFPEL